MADWAGAFGDEYTLRNAEIPSRERFWRKVVPGDALSALEIGCNSGANLEALSFIRTCGCDVNQLAVNRAKEKGLDVIHCHGLAMTRRADLVFTTGVLIHLQTPEIIKMIKHMRQLSFKYVLLNEYYSERDEEIPYRGQPGALYKRDFGGIYQALFPRDTLVMTGSAGEEFGFDNTTYWLWEKP